MRAKLWTAALLAVAQAAGCARQTPTTPAPPLEDSAVREAGAAPPSSASPPLPDAGASAETPNTPNTPTTPFDGSFVRGGSGSLPHVDTQTCKTPEGPTGVGHITLEFDRNGSVVEATIDAGPFARTAEGACVEGRFRRLTIAPFSGPPVKVGKSFAIN